MISAQTEKCIGCGVCCLVCTKGVFELLQAQSPVKIGYRTVILKNPERCDDCGRCVRECPVKALCLKNVSPTYHSYGCN